MLLVPVHFGSRVAAYALTDDEDIDIALTYHWGLRNGYAKSHELGHRYGRVVSLHRLIAGLSHGDGLQVDHINRDKLDNRRSNIRVCTTGENRQNLDSYRGSLTPYRGVSYCKQTGRWAAHCKVAGRYFWFGRHDTAEEAARAAADGRAQNMPFSAEALGDDHVMTPEETQRLVKDVWGKQS